MLFIEGLKRLVKIVFEKKKKFFETNKSVQWEPQNAYKRKKEVAFTTLKRFHFRRICSNFFNEFPFAIFNSKGKFSALNV